MKRMKTSKIREIECNGPAYEVIREDGARIQLYSIGRCNVFTYPNGFTLHVRGSRNTLYDDMVELRRQFSFDCLN